ncbi:MAG: hypothetical protein ABSB96_02270 [Gaiellaceae bacterium]
MGIEENPVASGFSARWSAQTLVFAWNRLLERLPDDWSHLYAEVELRPTESYADVALIVSPLNPEHCDGRSAFRFRVGRSFGYGAAPEMARRCLERLDKARIPGRLHLLQLLAEKRPVETQGPVWRLGGRSL